MRLRKKIMRRIYYAFAIRSVTHPIATHSFVLIVSFIALSRVVSIPSIWANMLEVKVRDLLYFMAGSILHTKALVVVLLGVILFTACSLAWWLLSRRLSRMRQLSLSVRGPELA